MGGKKMFFNQLKKSIPLILRIEVTAGQTIILPVVYSFYDYDFVIYWGDGNSMSYRNSDGIVSISNTFGLAGFYDLTIKGKYECLDTIQNGYISFRTSLVDIIQWGDNKFKFLRFMYCNKLTVISAIDIPDISLCTSFYQLFNLCSELTSINNLESWNTTSITSWYYAFGNSKFNQDISMLDFSNCTDFSYMFFLNSKFNKSLANIDVSQGTNFRSMFRNTPVNFDASSWDISKASNMQDFGRGAGFSRANYDLMLIAWNNLPLPPQNIGFRMDSQYTIGGAAELARANLITTHGWTITDLGGI